MVTDGRLEKVRFYQVIIQTVFYLHSQRPLPALFVHIKTVTGGVAVIQVSDKNIIQSIFFSHL